MDSAAEGAFVMGFYFRNPVEERGVAGITGIQATFGCNQCIFVNSIRHEKHEIKEKSYKFNHKPSLVMASEPICDE